MGFRGRRAGNGRDMSASAAGPISVVVATRNRCGELRRTLDRLGALPERPPVIVVDNASTDDTAATAARYPGVRVLRTRRNLGATARNVGVAAATTPYVAFSDDDSWWRPGSLTRAAEAFDTDRGLGLVAARTLVGDDAEPDPVNDELAADRAVLGFLGCAAVVRRSAFLSVRGFHPLLFFVGEERLLAYDLAAAGWRLEYRPDVVALHHPSSHRPAGSWRRGLERRNEVLTAWLRRPVPVALAATAQLFTDARADRAARRALIGALPRLPAAMTARHPLPPAVERAAHRLYD